MIRDDAEGAGNGFVRSVFLSAELGNTGQDAGEGVDFIHALLPVQDADRALQTHAGVHVLFRQRLVAAFGVFVVLHKDVVPDFQIPAAGAGGGAVRTAGLLIGDDEHLRVAAAGAGDAGGTPPVVRLRKEEQILLLHAAGAPQAVAFLVPGAVLVALEDREGQPVLRQAKVFRAGQELPAPGDHFLLEIVAQAPVAQHLEKGQMAGIAHVVDIPGADALLHVRQAGAGGVGRAHQIGNQGMHARRGEKHGGIVLRDDGGGLDPVMPLGFHEGQKHFPQLGGGDLFHLQVPLPKSIA